MSFPLTRELLVHGEVCCVSDFLQWCFGGEICWNCRVCYHDGGSHEKKGLGELREDPVQVGVVVMAVVKSHFGRDL